MIYRRVGCVSPSISVRVEFTAIQGAYTAISVFFPIPPTQKHVMTGHESLRTKTGQIEPMQARDMQLISCLSSRKLVR